MGRTARLLLATVLCAALVALRSAGGAGALLPEPEAVEGVTLRLVDAGPREGADAPGFEITGMYQVRVVLGDELLFTHWLARVIEVRLERPARLVAAEPGG